MGRAPCCDKANVKKGPWSPEEDAKLKEFIEKYGTGGNWIALPQKAGLKRCGKSCRLRWLNYLRPNIRHGEFSEDEDRIICSLYASIGSRWSVIAAQLPGRTDNDIKNYWNTKLKKKLLTMLPSLQEKSTFFPSLPFQPHPPSNDQFLNNSSSSSSFYTFTPNFMNLDNTSNSLFVHENATNLQSPPPPQQQPPANSLMCNNNVNNDNNSYGYHPGFQEGMVMFGSTTCSSYEGWTHNIKDQEEKHKYQIKQEDYYYHQTTLDEVHVLGDQGLILKNHATPLQNDVEEVKQLNFSSYLLHDGDQKGMCSYYHY